MSQTFHCCFFFKFILKQQLMWLRSEMVTAHSVTFFFEVCLRPPSNVNSVYLFISSFPLTDWSPHLDIIYFFQCSNFLLVISPFILAHSAHVNFDNIGTDSSHILYLQSQFPQCNFQSPSRPWLFVIFCSSLVMPFPY